MSLTIPGYKTGKKISEGSRTVVYRAIREDNEMPVIIKTIKSAYPTQRDLSRIKHEYEILKKINIDGVPSVYGLEKHKNGFVLILECIKGESLKGFVKTKTLRMIEFLSVASRLSEIVGKIHGENIIHKDINPRNIVIDPDTHGLISGVSIIDFGLSTLLKKEEQMDVNPGSLEGTLAYMSPEQTGRMNRSIDYRTDFYSLGVTFYEMLTGKLPFQANDAMELVHFHIARIPKPPIELNKDVPEIVSEIVMKLLAKNAEDRYQSAYGLKSDLEECLRQFKDNGKIELFITDQGTISDKFSISQKLYGRESEIDALMSGFERASSGSSEMILVSGYSGVGKSALVHEVHRPIVQKRGYFISGKYDQYKRNIPYSALAQAFQKLIRQILTESEEGLKDWKERLLSAIGPNAQVIMDVVPDVEHIVGKQPPIPQLGPQETKNRFHLVFQQFMGVFTQKEHPLVIFLDDLQWVDLASLNLLKILITNPDSKYLFVIGAYRDNEVDESHCLMITLDEIQQSRTVNNISLSPLKDIHIKSLISDTMYCSKESSEPLSKLVMDKTDGNPFFVNQFLKSLYEEGLIEFDYSGGSWKWDMGVIKNKGVTDNVVELMADKIMCFQEDTQNILRLAACIGSQFDLKTLSIVNDKSSEETALSLWEGIKEGLIVPISDFGFQISDLEKSSDFNIPGLEVQVYKFLHDRVQQAAYSLILKDQRKSLHLNIGRLILKNSTQGEIEEKIFDIVNHLNTGAELMTEQDEKDELASLNLRAGIKAKESTAYNDALKYVTFGIELLGENSWHDQYGLTLALYTEGAESAYQSGDYSKMEKLIEVVLRESKTVLDKVKVYKARMQAFIAQNKQIEATNTSLVILKQLGISIPKIQRKTHIILENIRIKWVLRGKSIEDLKGLPQMNDPHKLAAMQIMGDTISPAYYTSPALVFILISKMINLSVRYGNTSISSMAYVIYGMFLCGPLEKIDTGIRFGKLALEIRDRFNAKELNAKICGLFNLFINHWEKHLGETLEPLLEGCQEGLDAGDFEYSCICNNCHNFNSLFAGNELALSEKKLARFHDVIKNLNQHKYLLINKIVRQFVLNLMGKGQDTCRLAGNIFHEGKMLPLLKSDDKSFVFLFQTILSYIFCNYKQALKNFQATEKYYCALGAEYGVAVYNFYVSLIHLALYPEVQRHEQRRYLKKVSENQKKMKKWARHSPMNHKHKYYLVEAERSRVLGKDTEAMDYYDKAINLAGENEYIQEEAIANELAGKYYLSKGKDKIAATYMSEALYCYYRWGAHAKVRDLRERYPQLLEDKTSDLQIFRPSLSTTTTTTETSTNILDISSIMKASQAISGEIFLDRLLEKLMKIVIENAGAQKGFLIIEKDGQMLIEAEGRMDLTDVRVLQGVSIETCNTLPVSIINYCKRTQETVVLNEAAQEGMFTGDPYVVETQPKSMICTPIMNQGRLMGILYLENNLAKGAFTPERLELLKILSSQVAISIENAHFYSILEQKVAERTEELERSQKELVEKEKMAALGRLVTGIAHEINTPVGIGVTAASTIETRAREFEKLYNSEELTRTDLKGFINTIVEGVQMISRNLQCAADQIKSFKQVAVDQTSETKRSFKVKEYIEDILQSLNPRLKYTKMKINIECSDDIVIESYPGAFSQIVTNLVMNSIVHGFKKTDGGHVNIQCRMDGKDLILCYKDDGRGIDKEVLPKIFDPFFTTNRQNGGSGLGMHIIYNLIVQKLKGTITCESARGKGVKFVIKIPVEC